MGLINYPLQNFMQYSSTSAATMLLIFEDMFLRIRITVINAPALLTILLGVNIFSSCNEDKDKQCD